MKFSVLHLSDIHISEIANKNFILKKDIKIFDAIKSHISEAECVILIVTGDIAMSGKKGEYILAETFLNSIKSNISSYIKKPVEIILIPGNHDCFFPEDKKGLAVRDMVITQLRDSWFKYIEEDIIDTCCKVQENYFEFEKRISTLKPVCDTKLLKIYDLILEQSNIVINCFNTAWVSKKEEEEGKMAFPTDYFDDEIFDNKSNITINLIHHPMHWQNNVSHREFRKLLEETGDLILSGHEHTNGQRVIEKKDSSTCYLEAGALQAKVLSTSTFNLYNFDIAKETYNYIGFQWLDDHYKKQFEHETQKYDHRYKFSKKDFYLTKTQNLFLQDTDAQFMHSQTDEIYLSDLFVYPNVRHISSDDKEGLEVPKVKNSRFLVEKTPEEIKWAFVGDESSGKTTICKVLFTHLYENNKVPILIKGKELNDIAVDKLRKYIKKTFLEQYEKKCETKFDQLDKGKLILIIDDYQSCPVASKFRTTLIENLKKISPNLIFTGNTIILFEPITDAKTKLRVDVFNEFELFTILPLSADLRYELINNWNRLGLELATHEEQDTHYRKNTNVDSQIKSTLGTNYIPAYPFYILTLLQSLENGSSNPDYSLFGYYYEYLINEALDKSVKDKDSLQFYNQLLCELAYFFFSNKLKNIDQDAFIVFYKDFCERYSIAEDNNYTIRVLVNAKILKIENQRYLHFTYKYIYYFFVAKFFSSKISSADHKKEVSKMCERLYREEFSHIIVFLTHLSKDPFVINEIYKNATEQFKNCSPTKLEEDIAEINKLIDDLPNEIYEVKSVEENRAAKIIGQAEQEELEHEFENERQTQDYDIDEDINHIDVLSQLLKAIKTFELLGQVTKKYWGSIEGAEKYKFSKETYDLSLRTLDFYFSQILSYKEGLINILRMIADKKQIKDLPGIKKVTNDYIFKLCCLASHGAIKRVSNSIGHVKLKETYSELLAKNPTNSYKLIDLSIKLDFYHELPMKEIESLYDDKNFNANYLPKFLVRNLVYNHLMLYSTEIKDKQKIYDKLGIKIKEQRVADYSSKVKKDE